MEEEAVVGDEGQSEVRKGVEGDGERKRMWIYIRRGFVVKRWNRHGRGRKRETRLMRKRE